MAYAKCPTCGEWSDDERHTNVAAKLAAAELMVVALRAMEECFMYDPVYGNIDPSRREVGLMESAVKAWEEATK